ncbi:MAG: response regulator [Deltaproteobacteria bacterium]|nr:response regulator [Deltaproteobacteria bacterium]
MGESNIKPGTILVVDDDDGLTRAIANLLRLEGYDVSTAFNRIQGYAASFRQPTEFVITDIQMPGWDGFEMVRAICALNPAVKAVFTSGAADSFRSEIDNDSGLNSAVFLEKPFTRGDLLAVLSQDFSSLEVCTESA